jgi:predicted Fe-Mo cluster-binding NifX family protein
MQVALTVWQGRISPLFDSTRKLLVALIENNRILATHQEPFDCDCPASRAAKLEDLGVSVLICGGISDDFARFIEAQGIQIIPFAAGTVEQVLEAYLTGNL